MTTTDPLTPARAHALRPGKEADRLCATLIMGWTFSRKHPDGDSFWVDRDGNRIPTLRWNPSRELNCCWLMESELARRGLAGVYAGELDGLVCPAIKASRSWSDERLFNLAHADPLSRVKAALLAVLAEGAGKETR